MEERSTLTFLMRLLGASEVNRQAQETAASVQKVGTETKVAGEKAATSGRGFDHMRGHLKGAERQADLARLSVGRLVKGLGAFGVGYAALSGVRSAVETTTSLGEETLKLNKIQGLSIRQGADLAAVAHVRGLATTKLAQGTGILSRNVHQALLQWNTHTAAVQHAANVEGKLATLRTNTNRRLLTLGGSVNDQVRRQIVMSDYRARRAKIISDAETQAHAKQAKALGTSADAFKALGFSQRDLMQSGQNLFPLLLKLNDAFNKMPGGRDKTRLGLQIFGRGGIGGLLPLFREGPLGLRSSLKMADQTIGSFFGGGIKNTEDLIVAQQKAKFATLGLQLAMGQFLLPVIAKVSNAWAHIVSAIRKGSGPWGVIKSVVQGVAGAIHTVVDWFGKSKFAADVLAGALVGLGAAWAVEKVINFGSAIMRLRAIGGVIGLLGKLRTVLFGVAAAEEAVNISGMTLNTSVAGKAGALTRIGRGLKYVPQVAAVAVGSQIAEQISVGAGGPSIGDVAGWAKNKPVLGHVKGFGAHHQKFPHLAGGGIVTGIGSWVTGERGAELNTMGGGQVRVQPLSSGGRGRGNGIGDIASLVRDGVVAALKDLKSPVFLDGRELASSTVKWQLSDAGRA